MNKSIFFVNVYGCPDVSGDLGRMFALMQQTGVSGLQMHYAELMRLDVENFSRLLERNGAFVECVHVTPRLLSSDDKVFTEAVAECERALEDISFFGCKHLMISPFTPYDVDDRIRSRRRLAEGLSLVAKKAEKYGIRVVIENISQLILPFSTHEDIEYLLDSVKGLGFCFDTGNFVCTKQDTLEAFERLKDRIDMVHVKDFAVCSEGGYACDSGINVVQADFGTGKARLCEVLPLVFKHKPDVPYIIEVHNEAPCINDVVNACGFFDKVWEKSKNEI